ncbi:hypothetical protein ACFL1X_13700 [Candidatus Hydrogenedentota bacterium]
MSGKKRIWKIRFVKNYPGAANHLMVGEVVEQTPMYVSIKGKTYHYGKTLSRLADIKVGMVTTRIVPWGRIEVIHEMPEGLDYAAAKLVAGEDGTVALKDDVHTYPIFNAYEKIY